MADENYKQYLNLGDSESYQQVYASQVYGTFFTVQAKFKIVPKEPSEGDYFVESIDFEVINYKGLLDIGIVNIEGPSVFRDIIDDSSIKMFHLKMRGMGPNQASHIPEYKPPTFSLNEWINKGDMLYFSRTLKMLHDDEVALANGVFDSAFFYREGIRRDNDYSPVLPRPKESPVVDENPLTFVSGTLCTENITEIM